MPTPTPAPNPALTPHAFSLPLSFPDPAAVASALAGLFDAADQIIACKGLYTLTVRDLAAGGICLDLGHQLAAGLTTFLEQARDPDAPDQPQGV